MKKVILIIMDGIGLRDVTKGNAVALAHKPNLDMLMQKYPHTKLLASEAAVGLPKGQMGNSEVGHLNIGAGRIVYTGLSLINQDLQTGAFYQNQAFLAAVNHVKKYHGKLHIMGLASFGGVHSNLEHILALFKLSHHQQVPTVFHAFGDGRDVPPQTLRHDFEQTIIPALKTYNVKLGMISGRYYAMDRDQRWERVEQAYETLIGNGQKAFIDPIAYIQSMYTQNITDEFLLPALNQVDSKSEVTITDNDAVIFANFRPDRARELSHMIYGSSYYCYHPQVRRKNLFFVTMMNYEGIEPSMVAYPPIKLQNVFGAVLANHNLRQLRIAETEKYAHVTFFFDGGIEVTYPHETKIIVASPKIATYDLQPEMSAVEVCDKLIANLTTNDVIICNFANGDMVGHTGNLQATIQAVETVDQMIGKIYQVAIQKNFTMFITADHGNADEEIDSNGHKVTAHTLSPVPFIVTDTSLKLNEGGKLSNIAPTILDYMDIPIPKEMNELSLIKKQ
ncbi:MAG: 2,3-bisphosphoglycerate-independent phosphoglycerate mutase [Mycoplasmataceae bacterium]|jgi:2,3-bisphosphoglycerate-independent phosphoglycerate mutase|nr:2,3-bisphosphoglycerate-independent phosphoglycerate mutase [Mycoplasmataceae bacterium]